MQTKGILTSFKDTRYWKLLNIQNYKLLPKKGTFKHSKAHEQLRKITQDEFQYLIPDLCVNVSLNNFYFKAVHNK